MVRGKYIVLEGPEGVGKTTQLAELARRLQLAGLPVRMLREPDSQSDLTARAIRHLTQDPRYPMNTRTEVLLYNAARSQSLQIIQQSVEQGVICLVDRNYLTTLALQYYGRGDVPDYQTINNIIKFAVGDMEPDLCIVLDATVPLLKERTKDRYQGERFDKLDEAFLERVRAGYLWEAQQRQLPVVFATDTPEEVANNIWDLVTKTLAVRSKDQSPLIRAASVQEVMSLKKTTPPAHEPPLSQKEIVPHEQAVAASPDSQPLVSRLKNGRYEVTDAGRQTLATRVTSTDGNIYAFTEVLSPITIAAAMARLSRRGDDMRITLLDEFMGEAGKDEQLLRRVITAYGDDSVQQLSGIHFVVEGASNLLTKKLEWGRLAAYLEQSTRYIYFDQKDAQDKYKYYTPPHFNEEVTKQYNQTMDTLFDRYSIMVHKLTEHIRAHSTTPEAERDGAWQAATRAQACDAVRPVLPVATKSTVGIYASGQALESLIMHLQSDELKEAQLAGQELLVQARQVVPMFLERADKPDRGGAMIAYQAMTHKNVEKLAHDHLQDVYSQGPEDAVTLVDYWPKNELDLVPHMLYEHSSLSVQELDAQIATWPYQQKLDVLQTYIGERLNRRQRPGRALENAHYSWDIVCDYGIFRDLQRHRMVDDLAWQPLSPRYGFEVPKLIEDAQLTDDFEACFQTSMELYSFLQAKGYQLEAQYATLLGHKMRWKVTYNAREAYHLHELRTSPQGHPGYRKLVLEMHRKLIEVHPQLAKGMRFVNTGEDPELARLAGERYTQFKLNML